MGNGPSELTGDHHDTVRQFMYDIGIDPSSSPPFLESEAPMAKPRIAHESVAEQWHALSWVLRLCGCQNLVVTVKLDREAHLKLSYEQCFNQYGRDQLTEQVAECLQFCEQTNDMRTVAMAVGWQWCAPDEEGSHLTILVIDVMHMIYWFFNPENEADDLAFSRWMKEPFLDGYTATIVPNPVPETSVQNVYHVGSVGCCSTMCLLTLAAIWRCGIGQPEAVITALAMYPQVYLRRSGQPQAGQGYENTVQNMSQRLWKWQAALETPQTQLSLMKLVGLRVTDKDESRRCGVFWADNGWDLPTFVEPRRR